MQAKQVEPGTGRARLARTGLVVALVTWAAPAASRELPFVRIATPEVGRITHVTGEAAAAKPARVAGTDPNRSRKGRIDQGWDNEALARPGAVAGSQPSACATRYGEKHESFVAAHYRANGNVQAWLRLEERPVLHLCRDGALTRVSLFEFTVGDVALTDSNHLWLAGANGRIQAGPKQRVFPDGEGVLLDWSEAGSAAPPLRVLGLRGRWCHRH
jgi:hypothetical protein